MQRVFSFQNGPSIIIGYMGLCIAIYLVQLFPVTGIFLMFLMGPFWIGALIHLAMLHLAVASVSKVISRFWLVLPVAFYAGGYALHVYSERLADERIAAIETANTAHAINVEQPFKFISDGAAGAFELLERYRADRTFVRNGLNSAGQYEITTQYYARGETCEKANKGWWYEKRLEPFLFRPDIFYTYKGTGETRQCIIAQDGLPAEWRYRIKGEYTKSKDFFTEQFGRKWTVIDERTGETLLSVETGGIKSLPAIPFIYAGCFLNSGAPSWDCGYGLMKSSDYKAIGFKKRTDGGNPFIPTSDPDTWEISALARALSLEPRQPND